MVTPRKQVYRPTASVVPSQLVNTAISRDMFRFKNPIYSVDMPLQDGSHEIWMQKYQLRDAHGNPIDFDLEATKDRVALAIASVEAPRKRKEWYRLFREALDYAIPAGRIMSNAGAEQHKTAVSLINCTVSGTIEDNLEDIFGKLQEAGITLKAGCGIGYEFSTLRPRGAFVHGAGASTSGPLSFMDVYDKGCFTISSAGGRRGAQMGTFDIGHPDIVEFIKAKREDGRLRQFNLSTLITNEFMRCVNDDLLWNLTWQGEVFRTMPARELWEIIMRSTYDFAEPGFLLIDNINRMNNNWFMEWIRATNPCGEQPLPPYGSCLLGSINLTKFVRYPLQDSAYFDFDKYYEIVKLFSRMLDNVVELNGLPLAKQRQEILTKRRHGMGFLGLGSTLSLLGMEYGSQDSVRFTEDVSKLLAYGGFEAAAKLSSEKGEAQVLRDAYRHDEVAAHNLKVGNTNFDADSNKARHEYSGRELFLKSHYFDSFREDTEGRAILADLAKYGSRYTHHSSIAPTGTISLSLADNASNGIEPSFSHEYIRNVIKPGKLAKIVSRVQSYELRVLQHLVKEQGFDLASGLPGDENYADKFNNLGITHEMMQFSPHNGGWIPTWFNTADDIAPERHVDIQAAAQKWVDSSISKTINVPTNMPFEDFQNIYKYAFEKNLKGCTTFRYNPEAFQGVLVRENDLKQTFYSFKLADGTEVKEVPGDTLLEIDGTEYTAANIYDALKEGYWNKF